MVLAACILTIFVYVRLRYKLRLLNSLRGDAQEL